MKANQNFKKKLSENKFSSTFKSFSPISPLLPYPPPSFLLLLCHPQKRLQRLQPPFHLSLHSSLLPFLPSLPPLPGSSLLLVIFGCCNSNSIFVPPPSPSSLPSSFRCRRRQHFPLCCQRGGWEGGRRDVLVVLLILLGFTSLQEGGRGGGES